MEDPGQRSAVIAAVELAVSSGVPWGEIKDKSLSDLCAVNQDALIDDLYEGHPDDAGHLDAMRELVRLYDLLLGTSRLSEIPGARTATGACGCTATPSR